MRIFQRLNALDRKVGLGGPHEGENRRDYLDRCANVRVPAYVPREVYQELVDLHDRVRVLESRLARLDP